MAAPDFIAKYGDTADKIAAESGIPAERILGQAGLETGWNSAPAGNNFFGIKGPGQNLATHEADASGALVPTTQSFRAYANPEDSFRDYANLLHTGYKGALNPSLDDAGFASAVKAGGYATDPNYAAKLHGSIQTARQHHSGWQPVPASDLVGGTPIGAGAGLLDSGKKDDGWEPVPQTDLAAPSDTDTDTPAPPQAGTDAAAQAADSAEAQATPLSADPSSGIADPLSSMSGTAPGQAAAGRVFQRDALNNLQGIWDTAKQVVTDPVGSAKAVGSAVGAGAKKLVTDPAGAAKDVGNFAVDQFANPAKPATALFNIGAILAPGAPGRAALAAPGKVAGPLVRGGTELLSGVSSEAQKLASKAGELGGAEGGAFRSQMANPDYAGMQDTGMAAKQAARAEKSANWQSGMADTAANAPDALPNPYAPAQQAAKAARADAYSGNFLKHRGVPGVMDEVDAAIAEHMADATQTGNVGSMDALKQRVNGIWRDQKEGTPERRAVGQVQKALADQLNTASPEYAATMAKYGDDSDTVKNAISDLGLGERATRRSTSGKLLAALRPDSVAGTARGDSLAAMTKHEPTLPFQIAGATMNPILPRGIVGRGSALLHAGAVGGAAAFIPALLKALPALIAASPRAVGEARYAIGAAKRGARSVGVTQKNIGNLVDALRLISSQKKDTP